mmetsp:Transcript_16783/g.31801  ORF Transcript_16783/g.31801 Transcript_16783/m.31801 type:complete len:536 (+) Transcript_16783:170-1777(+)
MLDVENHNTFTGPYHVDGSGKETISTNQDMYLHHFPLTQPLVGETLTDTIMSTCHAYSTSCSVTLLEASKRCEGKEFLNSISEAAIDNAESRADCNVLNSIKEEEEERELCSNQCKFDVEILDGSFMQIEVQPSSDSDSSCKKKFNETPIKRFCEADNLFQPLLTRDGSVFDSLLEKNSFMCSGIDDWFITEESESAPFESVKVDLPSNRSGYPKYREKRIEKLKINLNPFQLDQTVLVKNSLNRNRYSPVEFEKRVHSFSAFKGGPTSPNSVVEEQASLTSNFQCHVMPTCGNIHAFHTALMDRDEPEEDDLCYDSDPNEILVSHKMAGQARKSEDCKNLLNESLVKKRIGTMSELMGTKLLMVWHRPLAFDQCPAAVHAWIEHGSYMRGGIIQPRLMWQETCGKEQKDGERFVLNRLTFHTLDLLDICKVFATNVIDRTMYPLANRSHCLIIRTTNQEFLFEAENTQERDKFVESLKILVAKLASLIIVGDRNVLKEFFNSDSLDVPGKVPDILGDACDEISLDESSLDESYF